MSRKTLLVWIIAAVAVVILCFLFYLYAVVSPSESELFPKCPTLMFLGFECPGCGSQRAVHALLNCDVVEALRMNLLLVVSLPYLLVWSVFRLYFFRVKNPSVGMLRWRRYLFGATAIKVIFLLIVLFCVVRNFTDII